MAPHGLSKADRVNWAIKAAAIRSSAMAKAMAKALWLKIKRKDLEPQRQQWGESEETLRGDRKLRGERRARLGLCF
ncbi:MAG: hypothetical protein Q9226_005140 [Calogaya cf. arnoldii]